MDRKIFTAALLAAGLVISTGVEATTWVNGYVRSDGTYVQGHYRSSPNSTKADNFSAQGNYNPYTGKAGTKPNGSLGFPTFGQGEKPKNWLSK